MMSGTLWSNTFNYGGYLFSQSLYGWLRVKLWTTLFSMLDQPQHALDNKITTVQ